MTTAIIKDNYADILISFGDLQSAVDLALQRYIIEQITSEIKRLQKKESEFRAKYGCDYPLFSQRMAEDEEFVRQIESTVSKLWEIDLAEWEFCFKGIGDWTKKIADIVGEAVTT